MNALDTYSTNNGLLATLNWMSSFWSFQDFSKFFMDDRARSIDCCFLRLSSMALLTIAGEHLTLYANLFC